MSSRLRGTQTRLLCSAILWMKQKTSPFPAAAFRRNVDIYNAQSCFDWLLIVWYGHCRFKLNSNMTDELKYEFRNVGLLLKDIESNDSDTSTVANLYLILFIVSCVIIPFLAAWLIVLIIKSEEWVSHFQIVLDFEEWRVWIMIWLGTFRSWQAKSHCVSS